MWIFDNDITYCMDECDNTLCMRHRKNIKPGDIYSASYLKDTEYCPLFEKGENVND